MSNKPSTKEQKSILLKELTKEIKEASTTKAALELLKRATKQLQDTKLPKR